MRKIISIVGLILIVCISYATTESSNLTIPNIDQLRNNYLINKMQTELKIEKLKNIEVSNKIKLALSTSSSANSSDPATAKITNANVVKQDLNKSTNKKSTENSKLPYLMQVMGVINNLSAVVAYNGNLLTVNKGDFISNDLQVVAINSNNIVINNDTLKTKVSYFLNNAKQVKKEATKSMNFGNPYHGVR